MWGSSPTEIRLRELDAEVQSGCSDPVRIAAIVGELSTMLEENRFGSGTDWDLQGRTTIATILLEIGPAAAAAVPLLAAELSDPREPVRRYAAQALFAIGAAACAAAPALITALDDSSVRVRIEAASALAVVGRPELAVPVLAGLVTDPEFAHEASVAISRIGPIASAAVPALTAVLVEKNADVREWAVEALSSLGLSASRALMLALLDDSPSIRRMAAAAIGELGAEGVPAIPALKRLSDDPDDSVREAARNAVRRLGAAK